MAIDIDKIRDQIRLQPTWRSDAQKCADYYDGKQLSPEDAADLESKGMGELIANIVKPTINALLGMEAKQRSDWVLTADTEDGQQVAEALNQKLKEAERESRADSAKSEAYAHQIKSGLGWVEVGRSPDPIGYPYRVESVHRNEIYWDWSARRADLSDAQWLVRERWYPSAQLAQFFRTKPIPSRRPAAAGIRSGTTWPWRTRACSAHLTGRIAPAGLMRSGAIGKPASHSCVRSGIGRSSRR